MNYCDYLRIYNKKDSRKTFIEFLINFRDYDLALAIRESYFYYANN